jgi:hypothetical protein
MAHSSGRGEGGFNPKQKHCRNNPSTAFEASGQPTAAQSPTVSHLARGGNLLQLKGYQSNFPIKDYCYARSRFFQQ